VAFMGMHRGMQENGGANECEGPTIEATLDGNSGGISEPWRGFRSTGKEGNRRGSVHGERTLNGVNIFGPQPARGRVPRDLAAGGPKETTRAKPEKTRNKRWYRGLAENRGSVGSSITPGQRKRSNHCREKQRHTSDHRIEEKGDGGDAEEQHVIGTNPMKKGPAIAIERQKLPSSKRQQQEQSESKE